MEEEPLMGPVDVLYDGLYYAQKSAPRLTNGKWPLSASLLPDKTQVTNISTSPPSVSKTLLEFTSQDAMRLNLPVTCEQPIVVNTMHEVWKRTLDNGTRAAEMNMSIPISTVEHENTQLQWNRVAKAHTATPVPTCKYGTECDACLLENSPGPLQVYLSVECQDRFDATGNIPDEAMFCLMCIRRDAQAVYMMHASAVTNSEIQTGRVAFVVPPFQNLVSQPAHT